MTNFNRSFTPYHPGLLADMYHPDAAYIAWQAGRDGKATFDLYARKAPFGGSYMLAAGLETAMEFVQNFKFGEDDLNFLCQIRDYDQDFLEYLRNMKFSGSIYAAPEGTVLFPNEPFLRVTAPFAEALLLESGLLQAINLATLIATKAARITYAARGKPVAEFALRRAQDPYIVTRSARIGGCNSTSFLAGAYKYRLHATGTVPHAVIQLFDSESEAFEQAALTFNRYSLLLDTYDYEKAIHKAAKIAREVRNERGHTLASVRLDSGDLLEASRYVRKVLDLYGLTEVKVTASNDLDEYSITDLESQNAPIDGYGVGTALGVGAGNHGSGALGAVYKLVWYQDENGEGHPKVKIAGDKSVMPGEKEVWRSINYGGDIITLVDEPVDQARERLFKPVMVNGEMVPGSLPPLNEIWEVAHMNLRRLPDEYHRLHEPHEYPVLYSQKILDLLEKAKSVYHQAE